MSGQHELLFWTSLLGALARVAIPPPMAMPQTRKARNRENAIRDPPNAMSDAANMSPVPPIPSCGRLTILDRGNSLNDAQIPSARPPPRHPICHRGGLAMVWSVTPPRATRGATPAHRRQLHRRIRRAPRCVASRRAVPAAPASTQRHVRHAMRTRSALHGVACRAPVLRQWSATAATLGGSAPLRQRRSCAHAVPRRASPLCSHSIAGDLPRSVEKA